MSSASTPPAVAPHTDAGPPPEKKPIHTICLDAGPLIKNDPPVSTLLAQSSDMFMLPSILDEIRDRATRTRVETTLLPFVTMRNPRPASVKFITDFARRTGDLEVMSRPDIHLLALTYELEVEENGGDWRLRKHPGQKVINGQEAGEKGGDEAVEEKEEEPKEERATPDEDGWKVVGEQKVAQVQENGNAEDGENAGISEKMEQLEVQDPSKTEATSAVASEESNGEHQATQTQPTTEAAATEDAANTLTEDPAEDPAEDDDGWITPSNLKKHQAKDKKEVAPVADTPTFLKVALLTSDYAMQNVALRIGLNLLSPSMSRITQLKNWVLRCHGCFQVCKKMDCQFCPRCGQATLTRVSCTTADDGSFQVHLKRNFQWNNRGNVYSIPKPVSKSANGKTAAFGGGVGGGGKNGWGTKLIFAEDQREYERAVVEKKREKTKDLMDEDCLPGLLTGQRSSANGKIRLGPGRGVNSRKGRG